MPYRVRGNAVYHMKGGRWLKKQQCSSPEAAQKAMNLLQGIKHGWKPTGDKEVKNG